MKNILIILFSLSLLSCNMGSKRQLTKETYKYQLVVNYSNGEQDTLTYFSNIKDDNFRISVSEEIPYLKSLKTTLATDVRSFSVIKKEKIK